MLALAALISWGLITLATSQTANWFGGGDGPTPQEFAAQITIMIFAPLLVLGWVCSRWFGFGSLPLGRSPVATGVLSFGIGVAAFAAALALVAAHGNLATGQTLALAIMPLLAGSLLILLQTTAEEVFFRGWLQAGISRYWGQWPAILSASALFAVVHTINGPIQWISLANVFLAGLFFGSLFRFSGGIVAPAAAHFGWNWVEAMGFGLTPNPGVGAFGSFFDFDLGGAAMWGGSNEAMNATLATGAVLLLLVALLWYLEGRRLRGLAKPAALAGTAAVAVSAPVAAKAAPTPKPTLTDQSATDVGCIREINEDAYFSDAPRRVWAVADGMGGHEFGERASAAIVEALDRAHAEGDLETRVSAVRASILAANQTIYAESQERGQRMGSTVVALIVDDADYAVMWAGDSRAYLLRESVLYRISRDHTQVQSMIDRGLLAPEDAAGHPMSHVLARAIGVMAEVELDVVRDTVCSGDVFLLCSDGLYGLVSDEEIADMLMPSKLAGAADALVAKALERGAPDNVTVVTVSCA